MTIMRSKKTIVDDDVSDDILKLHVGEVVEGHVPPPLLPITWQLTTSLSTLIHQPAWSSVRVVYNVLTKTIRLMSTITCAEELSSHQGRDYNRACTML